MNKIKEKVKKFLPKVKFFITKYWYILLIVLVFILCIFAMGQGGSNKLLQDVLSKYNELINRKNKELEKQDQIRQDQFAQEQAIEEKYEKIINDIEQNRRKESLVINEQQAKDIKQIVTETQGNSEQMAKKINEYFGIPVWSENNNNDNNIKTEPLPLENKVKNND